MTATDFLETLPFRPDAFQVAAAEAIDRGETVVVTAPTGSGKTVVAEAAIHRALAHGRRSFYTTPIKALSNQKFTDFGLRHGTSQVGLLTGDNAINGSAPLVVMTTEVLRNMMYADSPDLRDVGVVILDEVHYLQDRERGGVWEEIIVHLDSSIPLVCLSATIANAELFSAWIEDRRGPTTLVVETKRPVPLDVEYLLRDRYAEHELRLFPALVGDRPNERLVTMLRRDRQRRSRYVAPRRYETADLLDHSGLLPAIWFIFSRKGCEAAARTVVDRGLSLTSRDERTHIERIVADALLHLDERDLDVLGYDEWLRLLRRGVSAHHAGMVPAMKETVERLFGLGLVKLVFATETLALGINMPARTVVLESLTKFTGDGHELLRAGDFTQLTGRAGRRGIDTEGTAVVLHSQYVEFDRVAEIARLGSHPLRSSFRPTYNMAVNLVARYDQGTAETLLASSFAEFSRRRHHAATQADIEAERARLAELRRAAEHPELDIWDELRRREGPARAHAVAEFVAATPPGSVLEWDERGRVRRVAVLAVGTGSQPRILAVTESGDTHRFASQKLPASLRRVGSIPLTRPFRPRHAGYRAEVARMLEAFTPTRSPVPAIPGRVLDDPGLETHLAAAREARISARRLETLERKAATAAPAIVARFNRVRRVLDDLGYLDGWALTDKGQQLRAVYSDLDVVIVETLAGGLTTGLDAPETAAVVSAFTYRSRTAAETGRWPPHLTRVGEAISGAWHRLAEREEAHGVPESRPPDPGFAATIAAWSRGAALDDLFDHEEPLVGDFVRNCRQALDLLHQLADLPQTDTAIVHEAIRSVDRGVVAAAGTV